MNDDTLIGEQVDPRPVAGACASPAAAAGPGGGDGGEDLAARLEQAGAERDEYLDALQRLKAEFDNFRKRARRDQEVAAQQAATAVLDRLLPVLDAFDAARASHPDALTPIDGVLHPALVSLGVTRIEPLGDPFDPAVAEAVVSEPGAEPGGPPAQDTAPPVVVEVLRAGYRYGTHLLRPAMVRVVRPGR